MERTKPFTRRDGVSGHIVDGRVFVELGKDFTFDRRPDERLTPDQMADLTMNRITQGKRPSKYD